MRGEGPAILLFALMIIGFAVTFGLLIGSVILRAACSMYNKMVGGEYSESAVPEPSIGKGMLIVFVSLVGYLMASFVLACFLGGMMVAGRNQLQGIRDMNVASNLLFLPIYFLMQSAMTTAMLPTTFPRAMLVTLLYLLIVLIINAIIFAGVFVLFLGAFKNMP